MTGYRLLYVHIKSLFGTFYYVSCGPILEILRDFLFEYSKQFMISGPELFTFITFSGLYYHIIL